MARHHNGNHYEDIGWVRPVGAHEKPSALLMIEPEPEREDLDDDEDCIYHVCIDCGEEFI